MRRALLWTGLGASTLAAGCAPRVTAETPAMRAAFDSEVLQPDSVIVRVVNRYDRPLTIMMYRDSVPAPLGDVGVGVERRFALPESSVTSAELSFSVTPPASGATMRTGNFRVKRGHIVRLDIAPSLAETVVVIRWPKRCETCADPFRRP